MPPARPGQASQGTHHRVYQAGLRQEIERVLSQMRRLGNEEGQRGDEDYGQAVMAHHQHFDYEGQRVHQQHYLPSAQRGQKQQPGQHQAGCRPADAVHLARPYVAQRGALDRGHAADGHQVGPLQPQRVGQRQGQAYKEAYDHRVKDDEVEGRWRQRGTGVGACRRTM